MKTKYPAGTYTFTLNIGFSNASQKDIFEIPAECGYALDEWEAMSEEDRENALRKVWVDWSGNYIDGGFSLT